MTTVESYIPRIHSRLYCSGAAGGDGPLCVIVHSGRVRSIDDDTVLENQMLHALTEALGASGISSLRFDLPAQDGAAPSSEATLLARVDQCARVLCSAEVARAPAILLLGFSLGAQAVLRLLASGEPRVSALRGFVAGGLVIEDPVIIMSDVPRIELIFGEHERVGYLEEDADSIQVAAPSEFGPEVLRRLIVRATQRKSMHIVTGLGHQLCDRDSRGEYPIVPFLRTMIADIMRPPESGAAR